MAVLPPGTLLQLMYLRERLRRIPAGRFVEIGPGSGETTQLLLDLGWSGRLFDLEEATIANLRQRFSREIGERRIEVSPGDYLLSDPGHDKVDLVISCMVMEHLDDNVQTAFMRKSSVYLKDTGLMIALVPGSPSHWGIEDEIAGHFRRYTRDTFRELASNNDWKVVHIAGLTYPISNLLLPLSNYLVSRGEKSKLQLSMLERTKKSGNRDVTFKTHFPSIFKLMLNKFTMLPFHVVQKLFGNSKKAMVLYFECCPVAYTKDNKEPAK